MKVFILVGLVACAFVFGVRSEPTLKQAAHEAGKRIDAVLTVEDQIRAAKVEVKRVEAELAAQKQAVADRDSELAQLRAQVQALDSEKAAIAEQLSIRDAELRDLKNVVRKASDELTCAPETPVSVLAAE